MKDLKPEFGPELTLRHWHSATMSHIDKQNLFTPYPQVLITDSLRMGVNVHSTRSEEADQRLAAGLGEFGSEAGRRGDGRYNGDARREGFLHNLK